MSHLDKIKAASILENQIGFCLKIQLKNLEVHPIRLIQASKSLIGLNLNKPNKKLINFNSLYLESFNNIKHSLTSNSVDDLKPVISMHDLESAFLKRDKTLVLKLFHQLKLVSSEMHILEYLIEISLKQTGKSFLSIWSLYKSILFLSNKDSNMFINLATEIILSDEFENTDSSENNISINDIINYNLSVNSIDIYAHLLEAYNSDLIRSENIKILINSFVKRKFKNYEVSNFNIDNNVLFPDLLIEGRKRLLNFIDRKKIVNINSDLILFLDSIRSLFRFLDNEHHKIICFHFENILEELNV